MLATYIILILAVTAISFTVAVTSIFSWLRELVSKIHPKLEELIHCPWCLSHYILLGFMLISDLSIINITYITVIDYLLMWFACLTIIGLLHYVLLRTYEPIAKQMTMRHLQKMRDKE